MAQAGLDAHSVSQFDMTLRPSIGIAWQKWLRNFNYYTAGQGIDGAERMKALFLSCAGIPM